MIRTAVILSTGDELTSGMTVDTNSNWIADKLFVEGIDLVGVLTVGDDAERIRWAFEEGLSRADLTISTGGLGPTADDLTTDILAETLGCDTWFSEEEAEHIRALFRSIGRPMPENNLRQARFPDGAVIVPNPQGTAAGYRITVERGGERHVVVLPGVPREMKPMMEDTVLPWIRSLDTTGNVYRSRSFQTFGASESGLDEMLKGAITPDEARLSFRAAFPQISVRLTVHGRPADVDRKLDALALKIDERIGTYVFGQGSDSMETVVLAGLKKRRARMAVAESCTGGLIAHRLTNIAGSSEAFEGGIVAYTPELKQSLLGVRAETLEKHGVISQETALEMAEGARRVTGATVAVGVTGVAGPDGGTAENPVGTVCIAISAADGSGSRRYTLWGARDWIKLLASQIALDWVRRWSLGIPPSESMVIRR